MSAFTTLMKDLRILEIYKGSSLDDTLKKKKKQRKKEKVKQFALIRRHSEEGGINTLIKQNNRLNKKQDCVNPP
jgi:hypothetical protein